MRFENGAAPLAWMTMSRMEQPPDPTNRIIAEVNRHPPRRSSGMRRPPIGLSAPSSWATPAWGSRGCSRARRVGCARGQESHRATEKTPDEVRLPILITLPDLNQSDDAVANAIVRLAGEQRSRAFQKLLRRQLRSSLAVVLLDAWDEVPVDSAPGRPARSRSSPTTSSACGSDSSGS